MCSELLTPANQRIVLRLLEGVSATVEIGLTVYLTVGNQPRNNGRIG